MSNSDKTEEEIPSDIFLAKLQKYFYKNIFRETKLKLCIFQSGQRRKNSKYVLSTNVKKKPIEVHEILPSTKVLNEIKLDRILEGLINVCEVALNDVKGEQIASIQGKWSALCAVIEEQEKDEIKMEKLEKELKEKILKCKEMRLKMENERVKTEQRFKEQDELIESLRYNLQNMSRLSQIELRLVQKWEENRYTQATIVTQNAELLLKRKIREYQQLHQAEECRMRESEQFLALQMDDYRISIAEWQQKLSEKLQKCEKTRQQQEDALFNLRKTHESQSEIYKDRVKYINEYLAEKAAQQELLKQEMQRIESAVHIQAWWRGIMVRHGLGPFRKKPNKPKKSKK